MNKVILDASVIGLSYYHETARTGIFRVAEELFKGLNDSSEIELSLGNVEHLPEMLKYLKKYYPETHFNFVNKNIDKIGAKIENGIISIFPLKSMPQKAVREIFVRTRGYVKPKFSLNPSIISDYDIFHSPFLPLPNELSGLSKPKKVITIYDMIPILFPHYFGPWNKMMMEKIVASIDENTFPICISESTKNDLCNVTGIDPTRVFVVPLAASKETFYQEHDRAKAERILKKYKIPTDQKYFLSLSTLEPRKNIESTIRAFASMVQQEKIEDLNLVLVGTKGWDFDAIFKEIEVNPNIKNKIIITGYAADEDLAALYSSARGFVYPSHYEGFGLPPLEAMQCGIPVISSNNSSIPEVVGDAGILVDSNDVTSISISMLKIYQDDAFHKDLAKKALIQASKFSWEKFTNEHIQIYKQIS